MGQTVLCKVLNYISDVSGVAQRRAGLVRHERQFISLQALSHRIPFYLYLLLAYGKYIGLSIASQCKHTLRYVTRADRWKHQMMRAARFVSRCERLHWHRLSWENTQLTLAPYLSVDTSQWTWQSRCPAAHKSRPRPTLLRLFARWHPTPIVLSFLQLPVRPLPVDLQVWAGYLWDRLSSTKLIVPTRRGTTGSVFDSSWDAADIWLLESVSYWKKEGGE